MTEKIYTNVYVCGFNGFQQVDRAAKSPRKSSSSCCCTPQLCRSCEAGNSPQLVFTWSKIWMLKGSGQTDVFGFRDKEISKHLSDHNIDPKTIVSQGHNVIFYTNQSDNHHTAVLEDDKEETLARLSCDTENVEVTDATEKYIYGLKEDHVYRGNISASENNADAENRPTLTWQCFSLGIKVSQVSCGFDHTLMLTSQGEVYSCGSSSRGQLGQGDTSVDIVDTPLPVNTLSGIKIVTIAAGGWHSTAVAESGDMYVWGWNEAGQLGLPNGSNTNTKDHTRNTPVVNMPCSTQTETSALESDNQHKNVDHVGGGNYNAKDPTENAPVLNMPCRTQTDTSSVVSDKQHNSEDCASGDNFDTECVDLDPGIPLRVMQDVDPVQIQTVPYGLEIPDDVCVTKVACGSRHTCVLLDSGCLLTTGWNKYGQLGHSHTDGTDYLQTVTCFPGRREKVVDVFAGAWNTAMITT